MLRRPLEEVIAPAAELTAVSPTAPAPAAAESPAEIVSPTAPCMVDGIEDADTLREPSAFVPIVYPTCCPPDAATP